MCTLYKYVHFFCSQNKHQITWDELMKKVQPSMLNPNTKLDYCKPIN